MPSAIQPPAGQTAKSRTANMSPIKPQDFGYEQARHLLWRAGFGGTPQQINQELTDAYNERSWFGLGGQDPNEGRALDALMAANMTGGPARLREAMLASGADPVTLLNNFPEGSIERRLYLDLINQVPELKAQVDAATGAS